MTYKSCNAIRTLAYFSEGRYPHHSPLVYPAPGSDSSYYLPEMLDLLSLRCLPTCSALCLECFPVHTLMAGSLKRHLLSLSLITLSK